jgi:hypothetical protein
VAAFCNDADQVWRRTDPVRVRRDRYRDALQALGPDAFAPYSPTAWTGHFLTDYCMLWPAPDRFTPAIQKGETVTGTPVLILSGDRDPLVPTDITLELLRIFPEAHVLPAAGAAHPAAGWSDCARNAVHEFVRTLSRPTTRCDQPAWAVFTTSKFPQSVHTAVPASSKQDDRSRMLDRKLVTTTMQAVRDAWIRT